MQRISKLANHLALFTALSHILCCGLPLLASILSIGAVTGSAFGVASLHDKMHAYELHILIFSGAMLVFSGVSLLIARRIDCVKDGGCSHQPCAPKKNLSFKIFLVACFIFILNLAFYASHMDHDHNAAVHHNDSALIDHKH